VKIAFLNESPRMKHCISAILLTSLEEELSGHEISRCGALQPAGEIAQALSGCDALVLAFPLYVDSLPSHLIRILEQIRDGEIPVTPGTRVWAIINNGFLEPSQSRIAASMVRIFCEQAGLSYARSLLVGGGPTLEQAPMGKGPLARLGAELKMLAGEIAAGGPKGDRETSPSFPRLLYMYGAHAGWKRAAKRNGLTARDLKARPGLE